ncbi:MAG: hypothetical protein PF488_00685 [Patescibacteria group bacterium]|jgi:predicted small integral membrane protein|nr:hypothetical protein [Patescibacteria group bacterium]
MKINFKKISKYLLIFIILFSSFFLVSSVLAQGDILPEASRSESRCKGLSATECGDYEMNDFIVLAVNAAQWILGIVGSLTLIMFVYGGIMFLISGGSSDKVGQAKKIITAAVVGLLIVFGSWLIIRFALGTIGVEWEGEMLSQTTLFS